MVLVSQTLWMSLYKTNYKGSSVKIGQANQAGVFKTLQQPVRMNLSNSFFKTRSSNVALYRMLPAVSFYAWSKKVQFKSEISLD